MSKLSHKCLLSQVIPLNAESLSLVPLTAIPTTSSVIVPYFPILSTWQVAGFWAETHKVGEHPRERPSRRPPVHATADSAAGYFKLWMPKEHSACGVSTGHRPGAYRPHPIDCWRTMPWGLVNRFRFVGQP